MVSTVLGLSGPPAPRPVVTVFKQENEPVQIQNHNMVDGTARTSEIRNISDPAKLFSVLFTEITLLGPTGALVQPRVGLESKNARAHASTRNQNMVGSHVKRGTWDLIPKPRNAIWENVQ